MSNLIIVSGSSEPAHVDIEADADPTATPPDFQLSATTVESPVGAWIAGGSWITAWDASTEQLTAKTPNVGAAGSLVIVSGSRYTLWIRWGTVIKEAATIIAK